MIDFILLFNSLRSDPARHVKPEPSQRPCRGDVTRGDPQRNFRVTPDQLTRYPTNINAAGRLDSFSIMYDLLNNSVSHIIFIHRPLNITTVVYRLPNQSVKIM